MVAAAAGYRLQVAEVLSADAGSSRFEEIVCCRQWRQRLPREVSGAAAKTMTTRCISRASFITVDACCALRHNGMVSLQTAPGTWSSRHVQSRSSGPSRGYFAGK